MKIIPTNYPVSEYCHDLNDRAIIVNRRYQRSDKVWPKAAQSFLIESILLGFPIPKLSLYQIIDIKTKKTSREIIDGQQRSRAIQNYFNDQFSISKKSSIVEASGKNYSDLDEDLQNAFLAYPLSVDLFVTATPKQIRETFYRINSYTVPLNPEEQRHSIYQGDFKWFIYRLSQDFSEMLLKIGVFSEKQLIRMQDIKMFSEITHALLHGIQTTNKLTLDSLYKDHDESFKFEADIENRIRKALDFIINMVDIHDTPLMKPFNLYSLILAVSHILKPVKNLSNIYSPKSKKKRKLDKSILALTSLAESLEYDEAIDDKYKDFIGANQKATSNPENRKIRFRHFCKALEV